MVVGERWKGLGAAMIACLLLGTIVEPVSALDKYIADPDRFPGWKGELPGSTVPSDSGEVGYGLLGVVR